MMLRICPSVPITWRSPACLQFGVEDPVLIDGLLPADASLIDDLRMGLGSGQFHIRAQDLGIDLARATSLLTLLDEAGVLIPEDSDADAVRRGATLLATARLFGRSPDQAAAALAARPVGVVGPLRVAVVQQLSRAGFAVTPAARIDELDLAADPIVVTTSHLVPDLHTATWLVDREVDHCQIVAGEFSVEITGLVRPGATPCTVCACLMLRDADEGWFDQYPRIRALTDRDDLADPLTPALSAAHLVLVLRAALLTEAEPVHRRVDLRTGAVDDGALAYHPQCHCRVPAPGLSLIDEEAQ
ncbi:hypothetical protein [Brevibacterium sp. 2SA]|uniref:hypothetical protein n=1 Tax=Brevibacterium sp. 2SA TaxID=2502198 RepID=UPI0020181AB5|nr:hypothetical protein [Brevibacterium sp. 2SA]